MTPQCGLSFFFLGRPSSADTRLIDFDKFFRLKDSYTVSELRTIIDSYVNAQSLIHPREPAFISLDDTLRDVLLEKNEELGFLRRDELSPRLRAAMQPWHSISVNDKEPIVKYVVGQASS